MILIDTNVVSAIMTLAPVKALMANGRVQSRQSRKLTTNLRL